MSRNDVLVTADWAEENLGAPGIVFVEVDEDTSAYDGGHIAGAVKLDWKTDLQDPVRRDFVDKEQLRGAAVRARASATTTPSCSTAATTTGSPPTPTGTSSSTATRDVKLLDGGRKKWELDGRPLSTDAVERPATPVHAPRSPDLSIRAFRDEVVAAIGTKNLVDVRSPDEFSGKILAPAHLPQEQAQRAGHIPTAINVPWSKAANEDGTFKSDERARASSTPRPGSTTSKDDHRLLPHRRALVSHTWFVLQRAARPARRQELRRLLDRVRLARRRPDRDGELIMCGSTEAGPGRCPPAST